MHETIDAKEDHFFLRNRICFLNLSKFYSHSRGGGHRTGLYIKVWVLPGTALIYMRSIIVVHYCKGSCWNKAITTENHCHMAHTDILRKSKTLRRKRGIQDSTWEGGCEFFFCTKRAINNLFISSLLPCSQPTRSAQDMRPWLQINDRGGHWNKWVPLKMVGWWLIHGKMRCCSKKICPEPLPQTSASVIERQDGPQKDVRGHRIECHSSSHETATVFWWLRYLLFKSFDIIVFS